MEEQQELPQGWVWTTINQIGKAVTGNTPSTARPDFYGGHIPFFKPGDLDSGYSISEAETKLTEAGAASARILPPHSILVTCIGATIGKTGFSTVAGATNQQINALVPDAAAVVPQFAYFGIISPVLFRQIIDNASSTTLPILNKSKFEALAFPLPPLPEQRRIVAKLEELFSKLDAGVAAVRRTQALLKRYRQSVLHAAVTGELTRAWREAHPAPAETGAALLERIRAERRAQWEAAQVAKRGGQLPLGDGWKSKYVESEEPDTSELPELPQGWAWASLEQISDLDVGFAFKSEQFSKQGIRLLRGENIEPGALRWKDVRYWPENKAESFEKYLIQEGEIILAMDRPLISSGLKLARAKSSDLPCLLVQRMARFRPVETGATGYLYFFLQTQQAIRHLLGGQTGTQLPHISGRGIVSMLVPLPPLVEQHQILGEVECRLSVLDELEHTLAAELTRAERLRQSILHRAFTGRLVPQDATDEPAAALLARLRETPAAPAKTKAGRGRKAVAQQTALGL